MPPPRWPAGLPATTVRFARATGRLAEVTRFYRDVVGLPVLAEFADHDGYDGVVLGLPDASAQLELVTPPTGSPARAPDPEDVLVVALSGAGEAVRDRLRRAGAPAHRPANPYWSTRNAFGVLDPDGWPVLFVPASPADPGPVGAVRIDRFDRPHRELVDLFRLAEDSEAALDRYIDLGTVWVARDADGTVVGHLQAVAGDGGRVVEVVNTAVVEPWRGRGVGRRLLEHAVQQARQAGAARVELATAAADTANLRFYQRCGFRMSRVVQDAFVPATGYPDPILIDGIPLRDQVWFTLDLAGEGPGSSGDDRRHAPPGGQR